MEDSAEDDFPIVGIGASAGGLEAIEAFFSDLPERTGLAFVVIQHLSPDFKSYMTEILSRKTRFRVIAAEDQTLVEPDTVYMLQPTNNLAIADRRLVVEHIERSRIPNKPIDLFFQSLAQDRGASAVGVILSGTGSDGAHGVTAIHEAGGLVLVEAPEAAAFDGMPEAAIATNVVDYIGEPSELGKWIVRNRPTASGQRRADRPEEDSRDAPSVDPRGKILAAIDEQYAVDFGQYKLGSVDRRIDKRMQVLGLRSLDAYVDVIENDPRETTALFYQVLIGVTQFFRDPEAFGLLESSVLPKLCSSKDDGDDLRIWVPGCASGEEVYTIAIIVADYLERTERKLNWKIFATDIDDENLARGSEGIYTLEALAPVGQARRGRYFSQVGERCQAIPELRAHIVFARHNLLRDPPFTKLDLVSCRNLLIYLGDDAQRTVMSLIYFALNPTGILFLGPSEALGRAESAYNVIDGRWKIFAKIKDAWRQIQEPFPLTAPKRADSYRIVNTRSVMERRQQADIAASLERLLQTFVPPSFLCTVDLDIVHSFGDSGRFLQIRPGVAEMNLQRFVDKRMATSLLVTARRAMVEDTPVALQGCTTSVNDAQRQIDVTLMPVPREPHHRTGLLLVVFEDAAQVDESAPAVPTSRVVSVVDSTENVYALEQELQITRESLQSTIEELETTNEELQSTNEELLASNEELQSTNEELHSVNEELYTVNTEHQRKIEELTLLTRDEENLLRATEIGTVFLDRELRIRKFTPAAASAFHLLPPDIGRPLRHINHTIVGEDIVLVADDVLNGAGSVEKEVVSETGVPYLMRVLPYSVEADSITGVVISFIDVSKVADAERRLREQNEELERQRDFLQNLQDSVNDGYWDWNLKTDNEYMSPQFWAMFGYDAQDKEHHPSEWRSIIHPSDLKVALDNLEKHISTRGEHPYIQDVRYRHRNGSWVTVRRRGRVVEWDDEGEPVRMVGTHTDITSVTALAERDRLVAEGASVGIWDWLAVKKDEQVWSRRFYEMLGYEPDDITASFSELKNLIHPADVERTLEVLVAHFEGSEPFDTEFRLRTKAVGYRWMRCTGMASRDELDQPLRMVGSIEDIHARKTAAEELRHSNEELRQFAYAASHDLQAPLRHVRAYIDLLSESFGDSLSDEQRQFMKYIRSGATHMKSLIDGLLEFSRLEGDPAGREPIPLNDVIADVELILREALTSAQAELKVGPLPIAVGDRALLIQLFQNLIDNAIKFRDKGRILVITVDAVGDNGNTRIRVRDNGIGIAPHHQTRIFEIFQQVKRVSAPGTGIGLAICKKIVERLGGKIDVNSAVDEGATFSVYLPVAVRPRPNPPSPSRAEPAA